MKPEENAFVLYLAVLPKYRTECIKLVKKAFRSELGIFVSSAHLDASVRTGIPKSLYTEVAMYRFLGDRGFIQWGRFREVLAAKTSVLDLNPRSVTAWLILLMRRAVGRRTLLWGHIHPQAGASAPTAKLRVAMRRLASGTISYTYRDAAKAQDDLPGHPVWTAPNSLYLERQIEAVGSPSPDLGTPSDVLYVGRFAPTKKVDLLIRGFAKAVERQPELRLTLVGGGEEEEKLRLTVIELGLEGLVKFPGWIDDISALRPYYEKAFCSASPGFAGLGLTQSLGFGVPMIVADKEPHSPEIELEASGGVFYFASNSIEGVADAIIARWNDRFRVPCHHLSAFTKKRYSAEAMAEGLVCALLGKSPEEGGTRDR